MVEIIIGGIGYGLLLSLMVGPAFFMLIETSIVKGVKSALYLDLGVLISDLIYVTVAFLFFREVQELMESDNRYVLRVVGGVFFIAYGLSNILGKKIPLKKSHDAPGILDATDLKANNYFMMIAKGFMINAINPGVLFYWLTLLSIIPDSPESIDINRFSTQLIYITIILVTFFSVDVLKILGAKKLKDFLTPSWIRIINRVLGFILITFGTLFLIQGIIALYR